MVMMVEHFISRARDMVDLITEGYLTEFSNEFGISDLPEEDRFEYLAAWLTTRRHYSETTFSPAELVTGSGGDTGIDAIGVIVNNNLVTDIDDIEDLLEAVGYLDVTFVFVQAERSPHFDSAKIAKLGFGVRDFFGDKQLPRNEAVKNYDAIVKALYAKAAKFRPANPACFLYYVTTGVWKGEKDLVVRADAETGDLFSKGLFSAVKFVPIGASQLHHLYRQTKSAIEREFVFDKKVVVPEIAGVTSAYLGFLPVKDLLKIVSDDDKEVIKSLFYENVRDFLGLNPINQEIMKTLESGANDRFVLMNNGVTMITRGLRTTGDRFFVQDFQIVNGCQSTHVLHGLWDKLPDTVRVPFRLIHTQDENVIESVIRATNRQTEVKDDMFFAMKDFAKTLEAYFKTFPIETRIFYERRPHQYDALDIQKIRIITHQNLVRAVGAMFLGLPHITTRTFRQLTAKVGKEIFVDGDKSEPYYVSAFALYRLEQLFKNKKIEARYKAARYQILLIMRILIDPKPLPKMNSHEMVKRCAVMIDYLQNEDAATKLVIQATELVDSIASGWTRDTIRTEPVSKNIFQKFGQHYAG